MKKRTLWIKNIEKIVTIDGEDRVLANQGIYIEDGVIRDIGPARHEAEEVIDASKHIAYPGLVNTHHHLCQTFTKNLPLVQNMELFEWLSTLYNIWSRLDPDMIYHSSMLGMGELLKYGCTTNFDHHYLYPADSDSFVDTEFEAADALGIRFHAARGSMSLGISQGGLPPDHVVQTAEKILAESERLVKTFHDPSDYSMRQVVLAPCTPFSDTAESMVESARLGRSLGVRLHTHLCETLDEETYCGERMCMRPLDYLESLGWVGEDVWYAHGIHFTDDEVRRLGQTRTGVAHCPVSNMKLSSGVAKVPLMLEEGVPVGLGVDGSASNDSSNLLADLRICYLLHRLHSGDKAPSAYDILKIATKGGAELLGRGHDLGSLEVGKAGDLFLIPSEQLELVGTLHDPRSVFGTVGYYKPVAYTVVNGRVVVKEGRLARVDEEVLTGKIARSVARMHDGIL